MATGTLLSLRVGVRLRVQERADDVLVVGWLTSSELKIPKIPISKSKELVGKVLGPLELLQIRRDLVESYSRHILEPPNSKYEFQKNRRKSATKVKFLKFTGKIFQWKSITIGSLFDTQNHDFLCFNSSQEISLPTVLAMCAYRH